MSDANHEQIQHWNTLAGPRWVSMQDRLDAQLESYGMLALDALPLATGQRVLDVGCGCGATSLSLASRVGPGGSVVGVDIARALLARARERAAAASLAHVSFLEGDAQTYAFEPASADAVFSRFGVMFFDDPTAAFANLLRATRPGGALGFVCWRSPRENPWVSEVVDAIRPFVPPPEAPVPDAPGPFAFASRDRLTGILAGAGWTDLAIVPHEVEMDYGGGIDLDATVDFAAQIGPAATLLHAHDAQDRPDVRAALRACLARRTGPHGTRFPAAVWTVRATAPA